MRSASEQYEDFHPPQDVVWCGYTTPITRSLRKIPFHQFVSVIGSILLLTAYASLQTGHITTNSYFYQIANLVGAACLTYSVD